MSSENRVTLNHGRERATVHHHPWIFSGAIRDVTGSPGVGETVAVCDAKGTCLGYGSWSPASQIRVRMLSFSPYVVPDAAFVRRRVAEAVERRRMFFSGGETDACRLINAESDGLPGVVADFYAGTAVVQLATAGAEFWKREIAEALMESVPGCAGVWNRSDVAAREREGLSQETGLLAGTEPPELIEIHEGPIRFLVDVRKGVGERDRQIMERLKQAKCPVLVLLNKCDIATKLQIDEAEEVLRNGGFDNIHHISAFKGTGLVELEALLLSYLTEGPQYFPPDMVTDQPERLICAEMIREKALELLKDEVPHGIGVSMDKMELRPDGQLMDCYATILCERDSHKGIIIGRGGSMLKKIGSAAREDMEWLLGVKVNLQLWVKIKDDWRNRQSVLNELGYEG